MATYFSGDALKFLRGLKRNNDPIAIDELNQFFSRVRGDRVTAAFSLDIRRRRLNTRWQQRKQLEFGC